MMRKLIISLAFLGFAGGMQAQTDEPVLSPAASFLMINPDVKAAGMGDAGVAAAPGVWSMYWNPAAYANIKGKAGVAFSYTPWMRNFADGMNLYALAGYYRIDEHSTVALTGRFFSAGDYPLFTLDGEDGGTTSASDFAIDAAYARQFGHFSAALAFRFIHSGVQDADFRTEAGEEYKWGFDAANSWALDLGVLYTNTLKMGGRDGAYRIGLSFSNIGSRMTSKSRLSQGSTELNMERKDYLPAMIRLGAGTDLPLCENHGLSLALDFSKLLVEDAADGVKDNSSLSNVFGAFGNDDFMKSVIWSLGAEYNYKEMVMGRLGYFHESDLYGGRQYFTLGAGGCYRNVSLDLSYLLPTGDSDAPYKNTWRVGVGYRF